MPGSYHGDEGKQIRASYGGLGPARESGSGGEQWWVTETGTVTEAEAVAVGQGFGSPDSQCNGY